MNKLKKLEITKLLKELEFIESDYNLKNEIISEIDSEFINNVNIFLENHLELKKIFNKKMDNRISEAIRKKSEILIQEEINENTKISIIENINIGKSPKLKKLYYEIAKLTHPDKIKSEKINDLYIKGTNFYNKNDLTGIYSICEDLSIDYEMDIEDSEIISKKINELKQRIKFIESTLTWKWYYSNDQNEKNKIMLSYIKMQL